MRDEGVWVTDEDGAAREALLRARWWGAYATLMECMRRGEMMAFERWGRVEGGMLPRADGVEIRSMEQLTMGLEALWVGFGE